MPEKILVISQLPPPVHGSTVMTQRFIEGLRKKNYDAIIVEREFSRRMEDVGKYSISKVLKIPALCRKLRKTIQEEKPSLCILFATVGWTSFVVDSLMAAILRHYQIPYVLYFHGQGYKILNQEASMPVRCTLKRTFSGALGGIVLGEQLKEDVDHSIPRSRLYVLPNGVPDENANGYIEKKCYDKIVSIVFLSNLIKTKGPLEFLKAANLVLNKVPNAEFIIAGKSNDENFTAALNHYIKTAGLSDHVHMAGPLYGEKKNDLLRRADIFLFPTFKDTFPLVNLEAMQWGVPVISTNKGAIPDIIEDGISGFIVDPHNIEDMAIRVLELIHNPAKRKEMGERGRELFEEKYSLNAYYNNIEKAMKFFLELKYSREILNPEKHNQAT